MDQSTSGTLVGSSLSVFHSKLPTGNTIVIFLGKSILGIEYGTPIAAAWQRVGLVCVYGCAVIRSAASFCCTRPFRFAAHVLLYLSVQYRPSIRGGMLTLQNKLFPQLHRRLREWV